MCACKCVRYNKVIFHSDCVLVASVPSPSIVYDIQRNMLFSESHLKDNSPEDPGHMYVLYSD